MEVRPMLGLSYLHFKLESRKQSQFRFACIRRQGSPRSVQPRAAVAWPAPHAASHTAAPSHLQPLTVQALKGEKGFLTKARLSR